MNYFLNIFAEAFNLLFNASLLYIVGNSLKNTILCSICSAAIVSLLIELLVLKPALIANNAKNIFYSLEHFAL